MQTIPINAYSQLRRINVGIVRKPMNRWAPAFWGGVALFLGAFWFGFIYAVTHIIWAVSK